ncbi:MAG TPA: CDP-alcohol phosphatidyltransferase family protein [Nocardioidaceae bacterium]
MSAEREVVRDATMAIVGGLVVAAVVATFAGRFQAASTSTMAIGVVLGGVPAALAGASVVCRRPQVATPADRVTLVRAVLTSGCAAAAAMAPISDLDVSSWWFVSLAALALLLDALDGAVARSSGTTAAGARLDMELDAGMLVVLSVAAATQLGPWVLLVGAMRYLYLVASYLWPLLGTSVPSSRFRRTVAGLQGAALTVALAPFTPVDVGTAVVIASLVLLVASFAHQTLATVRLSESVSDEAARC